jgi:hypothetical protein
VKTALSPRHPGVFALTVVGLCLPARALAAQSSPAEDETQAADADGTSIVLRTPERGIEIWVTEAQPYELGEDHWLYPERSPCVSPCRLVLPNGRYTFDLGGTEFYTYAEGPPQVWDVVPAETWARNLAITLDVVGAALVLGDVLYYGLSMFGAEGWGTDPGVVEERREQVRDDILPTVVALGVVGGLFVVGSIPLYVHFASSGSASGHEAVWEDETAISVTPGAVLMPDPRGMPAFGLSLSGTWGPVRRAHR